MYSQSCIIFEAVTMFHSMTNAPHLGPGPSRANYRPNSGPKQVKTCAYGSLHQAGIPSVLMEVTEPYYMHINCHVRCQVSHKVLFCVLAEYNHCSVATIDNRGWIIHTHSHAFP